MALTITLCVIALIIIYFIAAYNGLIKLRNKVENAWADISTQLQRRFDLIPNLVETVKGYAAHEKEVFERVTEARANMANASTTAEKAAANDALSGTLKSLFAVAEAYPQLQASTNFKELQVELTNTENKISFSRQFYNDAVRRFNTDIELFPKNIIASIMNFTQKEYFETTSEDTKKVPTVKF